MVGVGVIVGVNVCDGTAVAVDVNVTLGSGVSVAGAAVGDKGIVVEVTCCPDTGAQALANTTIANKMIFNFNSILHLNLSLPMCPRLQKRNDIPAQHFIGIAALHYNDGGQSE